MHRRADMIDKFVIVSFHTLFDPVQHDADETVFIKIGDKFCGVLGKSGSLCLLPDNIGNQRVGQFEQIIFDLFPTDGMVGVG